MVLKYEYRLSIGIGTRELADDGALPSCRVVSELQAQFGDDLHAVFIRTSTTVGNITGGACRERALHNRAL